MVIRTSFFFRIFVIRSGHMSFNIKSDIFLSCSISYSIDFHYERCKDDVLRNIHVKILRLESLTENLRLHQWNLIERLRTLLETQPGEIIHNCNADGLSRRRIFS